MVDKQKTSIIRWPGLLQDAPRSVRLMVLAVIAVAQLSLSFTQLSDVIIPTGIYGNISLYVILLPLALGSLLLGVGYSTLIGLITGVVVWAHANTQAYSFYEILVFSEPLSILIMTAIGFCLGLCFAVIYYKSQRKVGRYLAFAVIAIILAALMTLALSAQLVIAYPEIAGRSTAEAILSAKSFWPNTIIQVLVNALCVYVMLVLGIVGIKQRTRNQDHKTLSLSFQSWLFIVVLICFMSIAAISYVTITAQTEAETDDDLQSEVEYLENQLTDMMERRQDLRDLLETDSNYASLSQEEIDDAVSQVSTIEHILDGYTREIDGIVVIFENDVIVLSDAEDIYPVGVSLTDIWGIFGNENMDEYVEEDDLLLLEIDLPYGVKESPIEALSPDGDRLAFARVGAVGDYTILIMQPAPMVFEDRTGVMLWNTLSTLVLLLAVFFMATYLLRRLVIRPINQTNSVLDKITQGDLNQKVRQYNTEEFRSLSDGINTTVDALKSWIAEAETRIDRELAVAKAIQESALPRAFPPYPDIWSFDIYASMNAAREVGGDFYDFFLITDEPGQNPHKLGFVLADVSGKGVPAALFMMSAKTALKGYMESGIPMNEAVDNANHHLCEGNDAGMFVTVFAGILDFDTGHVSYVNAGHNPPLIWKDGAWRWFKDVSGMPLGLFDGIPYDAYELDLSIGDQFLIYTDGVTEAMNPDGELYGEERLENLVARNFYLHPRHLVEEVRYDVKRFANGAEQSDDITMLSLEYGVPPEVTATLSVPADVEELPRVLNFVHAELDRRMCPVKVQRQLDLALEELFVNVARYAYPEAPAGSPGTVRISYTYSADPPSILVELADEGIPFDPFAKPDAVIPGSVEEMQIGGMGILMVKNNVDEYRYERQGQTNVVSVLKKW